VDGKQKLVASSNDMDMMKVGSLDDMDIKRVGSSGMDYFERGRHESGVTWWGINVELVSDRAHYGVFSPSFKIMHLYLFKIGQTCECRGCL
jgi:hypothetical protein